MKTLILILLFATLLFSDGLKVYLYTPEININNFKSLKMSFDAYLGAYGNYEFQPFSDKKTFEKYLKEKNAVAILSSWHYREIAKAYNLKAMLVAQKKGSTTDKKILVGHKNIPLEGVVTSAYNKEYTNKLLLTITKNRSKALSVLSVPKEIDALMSVGFGMSKFALVSKDSFTHLQHVNPVLSEDLSIYHESMPEHRMLLACTETDREKMELLSIFQEMGLSERGKNILSMIGIDELVLLNSKNQENTGEAK